ncbi:MAG: hypothetical protein ACREM3_09585 [Candidatus Rokuibacteriota bacterium]
MARHAWVVAKIVRERAMVMVMPGDLQRVLTESRAREGVWSFILDPMAENGTRLVMLSLGAEAPSPSRRFAEGVFWEPAHFVMERRMMLTIKRLAEQHPLP